MRFGELLLLYIEGTLKDFFFGSIGRNPELQKTPEGGHSRKQDDEVALRLVVPVVDVEDRLPRYC
jgi:single-stranded DNA-binding protein